MGLIERDERSYDNAPLEVQRQGGLAMSLWMTGANATDVGHVVRLERQLAGAVEALRWYAEACDPDKQCNGFGDVRQKIAADGGRRARTALGGR
jgi:hypothetical protein